MAHHADPAHHQANLPLSHVVLCCTSIPVETRNHLSAIATQMGASHKFDLTSDVTHLIVGELDTPKYKYVARERQDVRVLLPTWIEAVREEWMQGADLLTPRLVEENDKPQKNIEAATTKQSKTRLEELEEEHRLPTFWELNICVTGFEDPLERAELEQLANQNGGTYHGDLTQQVTHLVAARPEGRKYEYAGHWGIKTVTIEWFRESLKRGMILEESLFHPRMPAEERGRGAVIIAAKRPGITTESMLGKHGRDSGDRELVGRRKLRRTASSKLESQTGDIWADLGNGGQRRQSAPGAAQNKTSRQVTAVNRTFDGVQDMDASNADDDSTGQISKESRGDKRVFWKTADPASGERIHIYGFDKRKADILQGYLTANGACVISQNDMLERMSTLLKESERADPKEALEPAAMVTIVVPHDTRSDMVENLRSADYVAYGDAIATDWWVERCLHEKALVCRSTPLCEPFKAFPLPGFENLTICPTSFSGIELLHFSKAVKLFGAIYDECLRKETSALVCNKMSVNNEKLSYALAHGIPIVSTEWLWRSIATGRVERLHDYSLAARPTPQSSTPLRFFHPDRNPRPSTKREEPQKTLMRRKIKPSESKEHDFTASKSGSLSRALEANDEGTSLFTAVDRGDDAYTDSQGPVLQDLEPDMNSQPASQAGADLKSSAKQHVTTQDQENLKLREPLEGAEHHTDNLLDVKPEAALSETPRSFAQQKLQPPNTQAMNAAIAELLAVKSKRERASAVTLSASAPGLHAHAMPQSGSLQSDIETNHRERRHRPLGRALSGTSSRGLSRSNSMDTRGERPGDPVVQDDLDNELLGHLRGLAEPKEQFRPSQALSYEEPESIKAREMMWKKIGLKTIDGAGDESAGTRVESIGIVKDFNAGRHDGQSRRKGMRRR